MRALPWVARVPAAGVAAGGGRLYSIGRSDGDTTDCSRFAYAVLSELYGATQVAPGRAGLMLWNAREPWSPTETAASLGLGRRVKAPEPGQWHLAQGNRRLTPSGALDVATRPNGHTFFWYEPLSPLADRSGVCMEANAGGFLQVTTFEKRISAYLAGVSLAVLVEP